MFGLEYNPHVFSYIIQFGYVAIALLLAGGIIGFPVPDELLLIFSGYMIYCGNLHFIPAVLWSFSGSIMGMTGSYLLGSYIGRPAINHFGKRSRIGTEKLKLVEYWFNRLGRFTISIGYFIPGIRQLTAFFSALAGMPYWEFAAYAYPGGLVWVVVFITIGWHMGKGWSKAAVFLHHYHFIIIEVSLVAIIMFILFFPPLIKKLQQYFRVRDDDIPKPPC